MEKPKTRITSSEEGQNIPLTPETLAHEHAFSHVEVDEGLYAELGKVATAGGGDRLCTRVRL